VSGEKGTGAEQNEQIENRVKKTMNNKLIKIQVFHNTMLHNSGV